MPEINVRTDPEKADQIMTYAVQINDYIKRMEELGSEMRSPLKPIWKKNYE